MIETIAINTRSSAGIRRNLLVRTIMRPYTKGELAHDRGHRCVAQDHSTRYPASPWLTRYLNLHCFPVPASAWKNTCC